MNKNEDLNYIKEKINLFINEASQMFKNDFYKQKKITQKEDFRDLVTDTDKNIEKLFKEWINTYVPTHTLISEESYNELPEKYDWAWVLDPIDGTTNFIHQISDCAIIISLLKQEGPILSWIVYPIKNEIFFAEKGKGAFLNGEKLDLIKNNNLSESLIYSIASKDFTKFSSIYKNLWSMSQGVRTIGCMALAFSALCKKENQISIVNNAYLWEYAAGCLLVQEAGGYFKTIKGDTAIFNKISEDLIMGDSISLVNEALEKIPHS